MSHIQRFLIIAPARSGSTVLRMTLNSHPEITCHGEVLGRNRIMGFVRRPAAPSVEALYGMRSEGAKDFLDNEVYAAGTASRVVGFKALYYHFGELKFAEAIDHLISEIDIRVVFLWRNDLVKRALSEVQHRMIAAKKETPIECGISEIAQDCRNQIVSMQWLQRVFSKHPCLELSYEDLVIEPSLRLDEICWFLGAAGGKITLPERTNDAAPKTSGRFTGLVGRLRSVGKAPVAPGKKNISYPLVSNAESILVQEELAQYRNFIPWD